uniref:Uncharacterized protein n=1 Tax=Parascaris univalens TaxID=6257 RepID=A0A915A1A6_PARUN
MRVVNRHPLLFSAILRKFPPHYELFTETQRDVINERVNVMAYEAVESENGEIFTAAVIPFQAGKVLPKQKKICCRVPSYCRISRSGCTLFPLLSLVYVFKFRRQPHALSRMKDVVGMTTYRLFIYRSRSLIYVSSLVCFNA